MQNKNCRKRNAIRRNKNFNNVYFIEYRWIAKRKFYLKNAIFQRQQ